MATKTKLKLKKKYKRLLIVICVLVVAIFAIINLGKNISFNQSPQGQLQKKGYEQSTVSMIMSKMTPADIEYLLEEEKIDYVQNIISNKYFIKKYFRKYMDYYEKNSKTSFEDVVAIVNAGADKNWYEEIDVADTRDRYLVLVNKFNTLPENYDPGIIKTFSSTYAFGTVSAEETCYNAFIKMANAAKKDNITLVLTSGFRTHEEQKQLFDELVTKGGEQYALGIAAKPGTSEHETGLALDIFTYGGVMETFKTTETYAWLHAHAHEYGFIERYEEGKEYLTGYDPEAWHYRYVGVDIATKVKEEGITYEEYYAFYIAQ